MTTKISVYNLDNTVVSAIGTVGIIISSLQIATAAWVVKDDTAVDTAGGYAIINGSGFASGCNVIIGNQNATAVSFVSSTTLRVTIPAQAAGTYTVYVVNPNGTVGIIVNGLTYSGTPSWVTGSTLDSGQINSAISIQLSATGENVTYVLQAGSSLPSGLSLTSGGLLSGTVTGITVETTYNFTIEAIDAQSQESPRAFSITITANDSNFKSTTLLLPGNANTFVRDASSNNLSVTVVGDARPSNLSPYEPGYYSNYFDGTGDYLSVATNSALNLSTGDFTIEAWVNPTALSGDCFIISASGSGGFFVGYSSSTILGWGWGRNGIAWDYRVASTATTNTWQHVAVTRSGTSMRLFVNGVQQGTTQTISTAYDLSVTSTTIGSQGANYYITGYISNLRVVKGTAVYTTTFTPSTSPLTAIANTSLLTCSSNRFIDNSTNNFTITRNGDTLVSPFVPFVPSSSYATYGSGYFDGTGDYLSVASNAALTFGTGDFTVEGWHYLTAAASSTKYLFDCRSGGGSQAAPALLIESSTYRYYVNGAYVASGETPVPNVWTHFALVKTSGSTKLYINGVLTFTYSDTVNYTSSTIRIGSEWSASGLYDWQGYISNFRVVKGTAVYTTAFTPPTAPLTAIANTSLLTLQTNQPTNNSMFLDNGTLAFPITRAGNATQGSFSPNAPSSWSGYFDGTGDYLNIPNSSTLLFGSGNFTVETWVYPTVFAADRWIVGFWSYTAPANQSWALYMSNSTGGYGFVIQGNAGAEDLIILSTSNTVVLNQWTHVAVTRSGSSWKMFINGVQSATGTYSGTLASPSTVLAIAAVENVPQLYVGYISNLRVVKGTAVYTADFTPSATPLTAIANTSLLTLQDNRFMDDSPNNFTITRNGDVLITNFNPFSPLTQTAYYSNYFDGTGDFLRVDDNILLQLESSSFTIEAWIYPMAAGHISICSKGAGGSNGFSLYKSSTEKLAFTYSASTLVASSSSLALNTWSHVAAVREGTGTNQFKLYINGQLEATSTVTYNFNQTNQLLISYGRTGSPGVEFNGYISNLRIVKGTAVYTGAFTPSTVPLTAIANTSLLTCQSATFIDTSNNNFSIIIDGTPYPKIISPFTPSVTTAVEYSALTHGASAYFDGTGDYLTTPSNAAFNLSANFTIEAWIYPTSVTGARQIFSTRASNAVATSTAWSLCQNGSALAWFTTAYNISGGTINLNAWNHVAAVRLGSTLTLYLNGISIGTATLSNNFTNQQLAIGACINGTEPFIGYISDARVIKGRALYTSNFVPPVQALTAIQNTVLLANFNNGAIVDATAKNTLETVGDARISTVVSKFGGSSMFFDGTGDYLKAPASQNFVMGTGNFTIECWLYLTATGLDDGVIIELRATGATSTGFVFNTRASGGGYVLNFYTDGAANVGSTVLSLNTWNHVAVTRSGSTVRLFSNGTVSATFTKSNNFSDSVVPTIGQSTIYSNSNITGYIQDLRITRGVARYTANFTPPTSAHIKF